MFVASWTLIPRTDAPSQCGLPMAFWRRLDHRWYARTVAQRLRPFHEGPEIKAVMLAGLNREGRS